MSSRDGWGDTPPNDAHHENRLAAAELLTNHGAQPGPALVAERPPSRVEVKFA